VTFSYVCYSLARDETQAAFSPSSWKISESSPSRPKASSRTCQRTLGRLPFRGRRHLPRQRMQHPAKDARHLGLFPTHSTSACNTLLTFRILSNQSLLSAGHFYYEASIRWRYVFRCAFHFFYYLATFLFLLTFINKWRSTFCMR
jgi:hypothetical protein